MITGSASGSAQQMMISIATPLRILGVVYQTCFLDYLKKGGENKWGLGTIETVSETRDCFSCRSTVLIVTRREGQSCITVRQWEIPSETYVNRNNSPHPIAPLKSNEKRAVFIKIGFCWCNTRSYENHDHAIIYCGIESLWEIPRAVDVL